MLVRLELAGEEHDILLTREGDLVKIEIEGETFETRLGESGQGVITVKLGDTTYDVQVAEDHVTVDGAELPFRIHDFQAGIGPGAAAGARGARIKPPMPGKIVSIDVKEGDEVAAGQVLLVLEAMKMQNEIAAPSAGTVKKVHVKVGQNVEGKDVLVELE